MRRIGCVVAVVLFGAASACSSGKSAAATPCTQFKAADAQQLLGVDHVDRVSFEALVRSRTTATTSAADASRIAVVNARTCAYEVGTTQSSPFVSYEYGFVKTSFFPTVAKFLSAMKHDGDEEVQGIGQAAVYSIDQANKTTSITVLLSGGRNFVVEVAVTPAPKAKLVTAAKAIIGRL